MSTLRNLPVVCGEKQLGLLQSLCLDEAQKRVCALIISCGFRGKRVVFAEHVVSLGEQFILAKQADRYRKAHDRKPCVFVRDTSGLLLGRIVDFAIDEGTLCVSALNMQTGYRCLGARESYWLYTYLRADTLVPEVCVPADMSGELIGVKEELGSCDYLP